jgi:hypothetical protein
MGKVAIMVGGRDRTVFLCMCARCCDVDGYVYGSLLNDTFLHNTDCYMYVVRSRRPVCHRRATSGQPVLV